MCEELNGLFCVSLEELARRGLVTLSDEDGDDEGLRDMAPGLFARNPQRDAEDAVQQALDYRRLAKEALEKHPSGLVGRHVIYTPRAQGRRRALPVRALVVGWRDGKHLLFLPDVRASLKRDVARRAVREVRLSDEAQVLSWEPTDAGAWGRGWPAGVSAGARVAVWRAAEYTDGADRAYQRHLVRAGAAPRGRIPYEAYVVGVDAGEATLLVPFDVAYIRRAVGDWEAVGRGISCLGGLSIVHWGTAREPPEELAADDALFDQVEREAPAVEAPAAVEAREMLATEDGPDVLVPPF